MNQRFAALASWALLCVPLIGCGTNVGSSDHAVSVDRIVPTDQLTGDTAQSDRQAIHDSSGTADQLPTDTIPDVAMARDLPLTEDIRTAQDANTADCPVTADQCGAGCSPFQAGAYHPDLGCIDPTTVTLGCFPNGAILQPVITCWVRISTGVRYVAGSVGIDSPDWRECTPTEADAAEMPNEPVCGKMQHD